MASYKNRMAEAAIKDFPALRRDYVKLLEDIDLMSLAGACLYDERVTGGTGELKADRYIDRYNKASVVALKTIIEVIYDAYRSLNEEQRRSIALRYWRNMEITDIARELTFSERNIYRCINSALHNLYRPILSIQPMIDEWRAGKFSHLYL